MGSSKYTDRAKSTLKADPPETIQTRSVVDERLLEENARLEQRAKHTKTRIISEDDYRRIVHAAAAIVPRGQWNSQQFKVDGIILWVARYEYVGMPDDYHEAPDEYRKNHIDNIDAQIWHLQEELGPRRIPHFTAWRIDMKHHTPKGARSKHRKVVVDNWHQVRAKDYEVNNPEWMEYYKAFLWDDDKDEHYYKVLVSVTIPVYLPQDVIERIAASLRVENVTVTAADGSLVLKPLYELIQDEGYQQIYYKYLEVPVCNCYDLRGCPKECETCDIEGSINKA